MCSTSRESRTALLLIGSALFGWGCRHHGGAPAGAPESISVLFIGNSYTFTNDLPGTFKSFATAGGVAEVSVDSVTLGGSTLQGLWESTPAQARIAAGGWTHVVIQGQSEEPCAAPSTFLQYAGQFAAAATAAQATPVFYETWPRQAGDSDYMQSWSGGTPAGMLACLHAAYAQAAQASGGVLAPVGDAWMAALAQRPGYGLYSSDGSHPSPAGTYLTAGVMFAAVTHLSPVGVDWAPTGVVSTDASWLQQVAANP
jgi:hypothetical protein